MSKKKKKKKKKKTRKKEEEEGSLNWNPGAYDVQAFPSLIACKSRHLFRLLFHLLFSRWVKQKQKRQDKIR